MSDDVTAGVLVEERRRPKGRGMGLSSVKIKDNDSKVDSSMKEKDEKSLSEENSKRGTKIRKTKAGYEPYQVKKNQSVHSSVYTDNRNLSVGDRAHKLTPSPFQKRCSSSSWKYDQQKTNGKYYDRNYDAKNQTSFDKKGQSQNKSRTNNSMSNNKRSNYRTYTNKEKQKQQSQRRKSGNENVASGNDCINYRKNMHESRDVKTGIRYSPDTDLSDISGNIDSQTVADARYIELDNEEVGSSLSLSNSEPELIFLRDEDDFDKSIDVLENTDFIINMDHGIQNAAEFIEAESELPEVNLSMEQLNIIKEMDNKRRLQGIGILECPCSISLNGERVSYCDAHELIKEHNTYTTLQAERAMYNSELHSHNSVQNFKALNDMTDHIDGIYMTISPMHVAEEVECNLPSQDEICVCKRIVESCNNLERFNNNEDTASEDIVCSRVTSESISDENSYNGITLYNSTDIYNDREFPVSVALETSHVIDIENINALFMNLGRRDSYSCDSKFNLNCEKTWRSMDHFSSVSLHEIPRNSLSIISLNSNSSEETDEGQSFTVNHQCKNCHSDASENSSKSDASASVAMSADSHSLDSNIPANKASSAKEHLEINCYKILNFSQGTIDTLTLQIHRI